MSINSRPIRVLYVDDEQANLKAFRATYRRDFDVLTAARSGGADLLDRETARGTNGCPNDGCRAARTDQ